MYRIKRSHRVPKFLFRVGAFAAAFALPLGAMAWTPQDSDPGDQETTEPDRANGNGQDEAPPGSGDPRAVTNRARGMTSLAEAKAHWDAGRWARAADAYRAALSFIPNSAEARTGLDRALARQDQASGLDRAQDDRQVRSQQVKAEFDAAIKNATSLLQQGQFTQARDTALTAKVKLNSARNVLLNESEFGERMDRADALLAQIDQAEETDRLEKIRDSEQERQKQLRDQERREASRRQQEINQNLRRVRELQLERNYSEALQVIDQILFLDDANPSALALRDAIQTAALWQSYITNEREREIRFSYQFEENRRAANAPMPNFGPGPKSTTGLMTYPEDWPSLSIRRVSGAGFIDSEPNRRIAAALENIQPFTDYRSHRLAQVMDHLRTVTGVNLHVDWQALDFMGVTPDDEVTLQLKNVPARIVLERVLDQLGQPGDRPHYAIEDGVLYVSSQDEIRQHVLTLVYPLSDLLFEVPYFDNAPVMDLERALNAGNGARAMANATSSVFNRSLGSSRGGGAEINPTARSAAGLFNEGGPDPERPTRERKIDQIIDVIQNSVDPDGWRDFGGDVGAIQELSGNLIVTQTPRNHQQIEGLLSQLREIRALQINVESRFLTVDMDWFEQIGFDLDLFFNTDSDLFAQARAVDPIFHLSDFFNDDGTRRDPLIFDSFSNTNPFANKIGGGFQFGVPTGGPPPTDITFVTGPVGPPLRTIDGFTPVNVQQDSKNLVELLGGFGGDTFAGTILSSNPAFAFGVQFLDDVQVDLLIQATQADKRNVVLTSPRLSLFNGQRSWVLVGTQKAFISTLIPIVGDNSGAFQPITDILTDGVVLDVEAVISADRRYVTMTVITGIRETIGIETVVFSGAAGGGFGGGGGGGQGGQAAQFEGTISLPEVEVVLINTTTSVPDRGTILLGGQRLVEEVEIEVGVPVLSKIPFINRFFTNRLNSKKESTLLILIRPEIIIQQENEDLLFPGLSDTLGTP